MSNCRQPGRDARAQAESQAQAIIAQGRRMARQRLEGAPEALRPSHPLLHRLSYPAARRRAGPDSGGPGLPKSASGGAAGGRQRAHRRNPEYPEPPLSSYRFVKFANFLLSDGFPFYILVVAC